VICVCTDEFEHLGRAETEALAMPMLKLVIVPHPNSSRTTDQLRESARAVADLVAQSLTRADPA